MKKTYQIPTTKVVKVELQKMIAASETIGVGGSYSGGSIESRRGDVWDEDEE